VTTINEQFQADLVDMSKTADENDGTKFLLTCIDIFSKYAFVVPLRNKSARAVHAALELIFEERCPGKLQTDEGKEFKNTLCKQLYKRLKINYFHALSSETKCAIVERFNRTFKNKMWRYMTHVNSKRYIDVLQDLVHSYNHTYHTAIRMAPAQVNEGNVKEVWQNLYGDYFRKRVLSGPKRKFKFEIGDHVRLSSYRGVFRKGYEQGWTEEIYTISRRMLRDPPVYVVKDYHNSEVAGVFYEPELQRVVKPDWYRIEDIVKSRGKGRHLQYLVKFQGYSSAFNEWVPKNQVRDL
jgi:hypothetical protein